MRVGPGVVLSGEHTELPLELVTAEGVVEVVEHVCRVFGVLADRPEPAGELLAVEHGRFDSGQGRKATCVVDGDLAGGVDCARAEADAGSMTLADAAHAHDEADRADRRG